MCGRYAITASPEEIRSYFGYEERPNFPPRYNIAPTQPVPIIREVAGKVEFSLVRWGLIPSWVKEINPSNPMINARAETLLEKPSFKNAAKRRRCLLPITGFYEWKKHPKSAPRPYFIQRKDGGPFALAGIWEHWQGADGSEIETVALITTQANDILAPIHHRMPVILDKPAQERWLNVEEYSAEVVLEDLKPTDDDLLIAYPVSPRVNKVANDDAELIAPIEESDLGEKEDEQLSMF